MKIIFYYICINLMDFYNTTGYRGRNCDETYSLCESGPCSSHGICKQSETPPYWTCQCEVCWLQNSKFSVI